jgi:hypothetical protein
MYRKSSMGGVIDGGHVARLEAGYGNKIIFP